MEEARVSSWEELNRELYKESWQPSLERFRSKYVFRGMQDAAMDLRTGLMRLGDDYQRLEEPLLRTFRRYAHRYVDSDDEFWNWMAVAQHHGLPTRLLDWTYSPFVAMHFATADLELFDRDGVIWCIDYVQSNGFLPKRLQGVLQEEGASVFTTGMLSRGAQNLQEFDGLSERPFTAFLEPPSLDDRIVNQFALFSLMSSPRACLEQWLDEHPELFRRIIIPASLKWEVRDKLDQGNITERVLFPGLDGLSQWLTRYYTPRRRA